MTAIPNALKNLVTLQQVDTYKNKEALQKGGAGYILSGENIAAALHTEEPTSFIAYLEFLPNTPRDNHYHKEKVEYMVLLSGKLHAKFSLAENPEISTETTLNPGDKVIIQPGCVHTYTAVGKKAITLEYAPQKYDKNDVYN